VSGVRPIRSGSFRHAVRPRGMTLLEVLVAVVLLAGGLIGLYRLFGSSGRLAARAERTMAAADLAATLMAEWKLDPPYPGVREEDAESRQGIPLHWRAVVTAPPGWELISVELVISERPRGSPTLFQGTYLLPRRRAARGTGREPAP